MGLRRCPNSPCIFTKSIIQGEAPIYICLYVDDFIYFSPLDDIEKEFEREASIEALIEDLNLATANPTQTPYGSGYLVDKIPVKTNLPQSKIRTAQQHMSSIIGSLNWLSCRTRLDIATITNILAQYMNLATPSHIAAANMLSNVLKG
eukprot:13098229-Ditylum_brightwellii.AAC.1